MRKKILLLIAFAISGITFSQSIWKKQADLRKKNTIKETKIYLQDLKNPEETWLWDWELYDKSGRLIEAKRFVKSGDVKTHYKFDYPNEKTRILIELNKKGKEIDRMEQEFDLSNEKEPLRATNDRGDFGYEYDDNGNTTKVWRIDEKPKRLQTEVFYDNNNLRIKENLLVHLGNGDDYISTRNYERDLEGNIVKITSEAKGKVENIEIHEHKKHGS